MDALLMGGVCMMTLATSCIGQSLHPTRKLLPSAVRKTRRRQNWSRLPQRRRIVSSRTCMVAARGGSMQNRPCILLPLPLHPACSWHGMGLGWHFLHPHALATTMTKMKTKTWPVALSARGIKTHLCLRCDRRRTASLPKNGGWKLLLPMTGNSTPPPPPPPRSYQHHHRRPRRHPVSKYFYGIATQINISVPTIRTGCICLIRMITHGACGL